MKRLILITTTLVFVLIQSCAVHTKPVNHHKTQVVYVKKAPKNHRVVIVKGKKYYYFNDRHHRKTNRGFMIVKVR